MKMVSNDKGQIFIIYAIENYAKNKTFVNQGSGELEFEEFCTLAARFLVEEDTEAMQQELREAFRLYDKEGNGYITTDVFRDILHELDDKLTNEELDLMIEEIDADGSGTLDFDGLKNIILSLILFSSQTF